jgi:cell division protein FtsI (penicillin-binding protein 3)
MIGAGFYWKHSPQQPEKLKAGKNMGELTIVPDLQHAVGSLLRDELEMIDGLQGQAIVMKVQTGEILAMIGLKRDFDKKYQPCNNFSYQQELGSLMMTPSLLALLEVGVDTGYVVHTGTGVIPVDEERVMKDHNWHRGSYGDINLSRALEVSSNIGISHAVAKTFRNNQQQFFDLLDRMSFGQPESIDGIEGLTANRYTSPKDSDWLNRRIWWSAIGYERLIAPIQMLTFYNAIANNGKMVKPTLNVGDTEVINPHIARKENITKIQTALEHVVSQGLGKKAGTQLLKVAGKTGTSQIGEYYYGEESYVSEYQLGFCGYFPADKPKYSMIVSLNKLGLPASGGGMAGVVFHNVMEWMIAHGMLPLSIINETTRDTIRVTQNDIHVITDSLSKEQ